MCLIVCESSDERCEARKKKKPPPPPPPPPPPRVGRGLLTKKRLALAAILLVGLSYATMIQSFSWNQTSHYDLIRSLDQDKTTIDSYQVNTGDKAFYKGHWYSARAPGLALYSLPFYDLLKARAPNRGPTGTSRRPTILATR